MKHFKILFVTLFFLSISTIGFAQSDNNSVVKNIEPKDLLIALKNTNIQLIDVRTPSEFKSGHINKSVNINYYDQDFGTQVSKLNKDNPVYVYCRSGVRSKYSSDLLKRLGFNKIYNLKGGILSWNAQNLPLKK